MTEQSSTMQCPSCQGTSFCEGHLQRGTATSIFNRIEFKPATNWIRTHRIDALACLGCGYVMLRVDPAELQKKQGEKT